MKKDGSVVVVGGGLAGGTASLELRRLGFEGSLTLVGAEPHLPYSRPPLSKGFLRGEERFEDSLVAAREEYEKQGVELRLGRRAIALDPQAKVVRLDDGGQLLYDRVLVTTGGRKRRLAFPGSDLDRVFDLRTVEDSERIRSEARAGRSAVVIGLGFIGCEVAASLRMLGLEVTAIDPNPTPLARVLGPQVGAVIAAMHRAHGVRLLVQEGVERLDGAGHVERVVTRAGHRLDCDFVVAGIGIQPDVELLEKAGAAVSNGVDVDEYCRTSLPDVFAAGDIANHMHPVFGRIRVEHWNNAEKQGASAAGSLLGRGAAYDYIHSFWSDQFDQTLEYVGLAKEWDRLDVEGSLETLDFIASYFQSNRLLAAAAVGRGGDPEAPGESELKQLTRRIRDAAPKR